MKVQVVLNLGSTNDVQVCVDADVYNNSITASTNPNSFALVGLLTNKQYLYAITHAKA
jgi:hypothetical protein